MAFQAFSALGRSGNDMGGGVKWTVEIPGVNKGQAAMLLLEYWTAIGFQPYEQSYNRFVLRRNGYGTLSSLAESIVYSRSSLDSCPFELTALIQSLPQHVVLSLTIMLGGAWQEIRKGDLMRLTESWVDEFIEFADEWIKHDHGTIE